MPMSSERRPRERALGQDPASKGEQSAENVNWRSERCVLRRFRGVRSSISAVFQTPFPPVIDTGVAVGSIVPLQPRAAVPPVVETRTTQPDGRGNPYRALTALLWPRCQT